MIQPGKSPLKFDCLSKKAFKNNKFDQQTLIMISRAESFLCLDKYETLEESQSIQRPKLWVSINHNKDENNSLKSQKQNNAHEAYSQKFKQRIRMYLCMDVCVYVYIICTTWYNLD